MTGPRIVWAGRNRPGGPWRSPRRSPLSTSSEGCSALAISDADGEDVREYRPGVSNIVLRFELDREGPPPSSSECPRSRRKVLASARLVAPGALRVEGRVMGNHRGDPSGRLSPPAGRCNPKLKESGSSTSSRVERRLIITPEARRKRNMPRGRACRMRDGRLSRTAMPA